MGATQHTTWKPPFPVTDPTQAKYWQSISQWLRVPWTKSWQLTYNGSEATGIYTDIPGASTTMTIKKLRDETRLSFAINGGFYCTVGPAVMFVQVYINGSAYTVGLSYANWANTHRHFGGHMDVDSVPAGTHTFTLRWARGYNTITTNADDNWSVQVTETNKDPDT